MTVNVHPAAGTDDGSEPGSSPTPSTPPEAHDTLAQTGGSVAAPLVVGGGSLAALGAVVMAVAAWRRRRDVI